MVRKRCSRLRSHPRREKHQPPAGERAQCWSSPGCAWYRGSVWTAILFHGFWNFFIHLFYLVLTTPTEAGSLMLGEFGWFVVLAYAVLVVVF